MAEKPKNALITLADAHRENLWGLRANYLPNISQEVYFKRALITVLESKELAAMAKTEAGAMSILTCIGKALQLGLQIGGSIPQAYIVPSRDRDGNQNAVLIPTVDGYRFITLAEPSPVLRSFNTKAVYDGEDFTLDFGTGEVRHTYDGKTKRGKLIGVYCQIEELSGAKKVEYMPREEIERIRDRYSRSFAKTGKGIWLDEFDSMCRKTAAKKFLKPYAALKEGLAMALAVDDGDHGASSIRDRVGDRLDDIIDAETVPAQLEPAREKAPEPEKTERAEKAPKGKDIF